MSSQALNTENSPWIPFEDRRRARDEKRDAVLRMAVKMFLEDGYHRTSLTDVASRLNITKPALYNYFRSKDEILSDCYRAGFSLYEKAIEAVVIAGNDGLTCLRGLIREYALSITTDFGRCVVRLDDRELLPEARKYVRDTKKRVHRTFHDTIIRGMSDGSIRPCDAAMTSFLITGALNGIGTWFSPDGAVPANEVADHFVMQLTANIAARPE